MGIGEFKQSLKTQPEVEESAFRYILDAPHTVSEITKRMVLRLVPYLLPTSEADLKPAGRNRHIRFLRLILLGLQPSKFVNDQIIGIIANDMGVLGDIRREQTSHSGGINPSWVGEQCVVALCMQSLEWAKVAAQASTIERVLKLSFQIERAYGFSPSDVSEGHGELFSTLPENLGRDITHGSKGQDVFRLSLFEHDEINSDALGNWSGFTAFCESQPHWSFWREWYQSFLDGQPLDWELQRRVALIPDEDWDQGPEHIAKCIEEIRARFALEQEIAALKERLSKAVVAPEVVDRLHNQPPEPVEDVEARVRRDILLVWDHLEDLEAEIAKPEPSPSRLGKIADALLGLAKKVTAYCAELGDIVAKKAAEEIGTTGTKWAIRATVTYFTAENEGVQAVAKAIWEYAKTLPPG